MIHELVDPDREITHREPQSVARMEIEFQMLSDILLFPAGTRILGIRQSIERKDVAEILIEAEGLPKTSPGEIITKVTPQYRRVVTSRPEFMSWYY